MIDHTWAIFASNAELLLNGLSEIFTTLFESGTAIIDFVLDTVSHINNCLSGLMISNSWINCQIVFLSILFQLLCSSGEKFRPLEVLQQMSPAEGAAAQISADIESAVR